MLLDRSGDLKPIRCGTGWRARDREHRDTHDAVISLYGHSHRCGPVFYAFFSPFLMFVGPEISIADNLGRLGGGNIHHRLARAFAKLRFYLVCFRGRLGGGDGIDEFVGRLMGAIDAAVAS